MLDPEAAVRATDMPEFRFKGGTSISKVFGFIHRFSEDIDISLDRAALGFSPGDRDLANPALSGSKRRQLDEELRAAIEKTVKEAILPRLQAGCGAILGTEGWSVAASDEANEEMTLLFNYPVAVEYVGLPAAADQGRVWTWRSATQPEASDQAVCSGRVSETVHAGCRGRRS